MMVYFVGVGLGGVSKNPKNPKITIDGAAFTSLRGVPIVVRKGCAFIRESKLIICNLE